MTGPLVTTALIASALLLTLAVPRALARWRPARTDPLAGLLLWQAVSVSGVLCALLAAPVAVLTLDVLRHPLLLGVALLISGLMLVRVLWSGHRVGTDLRRLRAEHRAMVDLVGERLEDLDLGVAQDPVRVLDHPSPTAFCLPGRGDRIVLTRATVERLGTDELRAVLAHEQAHLDHRHDLLLEMFTVLHESVPARLRAHAALREVHLLAEALADRRAAHRASAPALARALVAMVAPAALDRADVRPDRGDPSEGFGASGRQVRPDLSLIEPSLAAVGHGAQVRTRLGLLARPPAARHLRAGLLGAAAGVLALPGVLVLLLLA